MKEKTFICPECNCVVFERYRHPEKPEVCFLCYVSPADQKLIEKLTKEVCEGE